MRRRHAHGETFEAVVPLGDGGPADLSGALGRGGRMAAIGLAAAMAFSGATVGTGARTEDASVILANRIAEASTHVAGNVLTLLTSPVHAAVELVMGNGGKVVAPAAALPQIDPAQVASAMERARQVAQDWAIEADAGAAMARIAAADATAAQAFAQQQAAAAAAAQRQAAEQAAAQQAAAEKAAADQAAAEKAAAEQAAAEQAAAEQRAADRQAAAQRASSGGDGSQASGGESRSGGGRVAAAAAAVAAPVAVAAAPATLGTASAAGLTSAAEDQFVDLLNVERAKAGLPALQFDGSLLQAARNQAAVIAANGALSHQSLSPLLGAWRIAGENVGYGPSVGVVNDALVHSPSHYANMVNPAFTHVAAAVVTTPDGRCWLSEVFAGH